MQRGDHGLVQRQVEEPATPSRRVGAFGRAEGTTPVPRFWVIQRDPVRALLSELLGNRRRG